MSWSSIFNLGDRRHWCIRSWFIWSKVSYHGPKAIKLWQNKNSRAISLIYRENKTYFAAENNNKKIGFKWFFFFFFTYTLFSRTILKHTEKSQSSQHQVWVLWEEKLFCPKCISQPKQHEDSWEGLTFIFTLHWTETPHSFTICCCCCAERQNIICLSRLFCVEEWMFHGSASEGSWEGRPLFSVGMNFTQRCDTGAATSFLCKPTVDMRKDTWGSWVPSPPVIVVPQSSARNKQHNFLTFHSYISFFFLMFTTEKWYWCLSGLT